jgi:hypothetical protein
MKLHSQTGRQAGLRCRASEDGSIPRELGRRQDQQRIDVRVAHRSKRCAIVIWATDREALNRQP